MALDYPTLFRQQIPRGVRRSLTCIQQVPSRLSAEDREQALHTLSFALHLEESWPLTRDLLLALAPVMEQAGFRDEWVAYLVQGIERSQHLCDGETEAELRFHLGMLYQQQAHFAEAWVEYERSAAHFALTGERLRHGRALNRLAYVARRQSRFEEARGLVELALGLVGAAPTEKGYSHFVLATLAYDRRDWEAAAALFRSSLAEWEQAGAQRLLGWGLTNLGTALWALRDYTAAAECYQRAIPMFEAIGDPVNQAVARMNLGNSYLTLDRAQAALDLYHQAEPIFRRTQDQLNLAMVYNNYGMAYQKLQAWEAARSAYHASINQWQRLGNVGALVNVMDNLGTLYVEQGQINAAIGTFQEALAQLAALRQHSDFERLFAMLNANLREAELRLRVPD